MQNRPSSRGAARPLYDYSLPGMRLFTWIPQIERLGPSYVRGRRRSGICLGAFCFGCGYLTAFIVTRNQWRDEMIKRGVARYNWQTGKWEWGEPPSRPDWDEARSIAAVLSGQNGNLTR